MRIRRTLVTLGLIVVALALVGAYDPDLAEKWAPPLGPYAHALHDRLPEALKAPAAPPPSAEASKGPPPAHVSIAEARTAPYPLYVEGLGQVQAFNTVTVRTRVDGQVVKIGFDEGQMVQAGDLIAQIDARPYQAALDQAKAKKAQDDANLANAKLDLQRYTTLAKQSYATQQQLDTQNALVSQLIAQLAADSASIDAASVQLDYTTIRAPISGRAGFRLVDQGNIVAASQQTGIVTIAQLQPISVVFTAPQDEVVAINAAMAAGSPRTEVFNSGDDKVLAAGKLTVVDNQVDAAAGSIRLKAEFENKDNVLWPGLAVTTRLTIGVLQDAIVIPQIAVQRGANGLFVFTLDASNRAHVRQVQVTHQDQELAVVAKGLNAGERVVTGGQYVLQEGTQAVIDAAPASGT